MSRIKKTLSIFAALATALPAFAGEVAHGVSSAPEVLFKVGPLPVTNSMVTSWVVAALLITVIRIAIKKPQLVPTRGQAMVESLVEGVLDLISPIVGSKVAKHTFPLLIALFTFILIQNWSGLLPGVGTIFYQKKELIRWIVKLDISTLLNNLQILTIATPMTTVPRLEGRMRGGAVVNLQLDSAYFAYASWKLIHEEVRGINEEGSKQCSWMQSWVGTTEWAAAPWNK